jgi:hypothetical protein
LRWGDSSSPLPAKASMELNRAASILGLPNLTPVRPRPSTFARTPDKI